MLTNAYLECIMKQNLRGIFVKQAYPIIITKNADFYVVSIPDFQIGTQGETLAEAMEMARDAIGMCGCYMQDEKKGYSNAILHGKCY